MDRPPDIDDGSCTSLIDDLPPLETVREMIKYETSLRLSESVQALFDLYHTDDNAITYVKY